ncbi:MAG: hypothetical protein KAI47_15825 [Deltaproteobacteria bacterium]|nr:hypothetical protein [Deltaproteobacteria bacterium]
MGMNRGQWGIGVWIAVGILSVGLCACEKDTTGGGVGDAGVLDSNGDGAQIQSDGVVSETSGPFLDGNIVTEQGIELPPGSTMGPGTKKEYVPGSGNSEGVQTDKDGWLRLKSDLSADRNNLWVANADEDTVSNVDTKLIKEVGRYFTGLGTGSNPSRTSVDLAGDVFIGHRSDGSVTKIAASTGRCVDRNGKAGIQTSTTSTPLPRSTNATSGFPVGQSTDECVLWTKDLSKEAIGCGGIRGVAATAETGVNFEFNGHVWIGCRDTNTIFKLNGKTGAVMASYGPFDGKNSTLEVKSYGFVLDKKGTNRLWIAGKDGDKAVYWMDTQSGTMHKAVDAANGNAPTPYGIAMDDHSHVWIATKDDGKEGVQPNLAGDIWRYDPLAKKWEGVHVADGVKFKGLAVDVWGFVWAIDNASKPARIYMIDPATFPKASCVHGPYSLGDSNNSPESGGGVAIDFDGHVWGVSKKGCPTGAKDGCATRLKVDRSGSLPVVAAKVDIVPVGEGTYSYSDMIGYSLRNFTTKEGWYRQTFDVCNDRSTKWQKMAFESKVPAGTRFIIRARTADKMADIANVAWRTVVRVPPDSSPVVLPSDMKEGHFIQLEVRLYTQDSAITPSVGKIGFTFTCTKTIL